MSDSVVVRVPASTSNCGPGFDTLGLALNIYGTVRISLRNDDRVEYAGKVGDFPAAATDMVKAVAELFCKETGSRKHGFDFDIESAVPVARGLGSSVILRGGILACLNELHGSPLSRDEQVGLITQIEGHPDNASAAILGGFTVARFCPETHLYLGTQKFEVDADLTFVIVSPEMEIKTDDSRTALPHELSFTKVVSSLNSLSYLVAAFASKNYEALEACRVDHLHEPYRLQNIPQGAEAIRSGIEAGAYTGWLSGSGSSLLCVSTEANADSVRKAMESSLSDHSLPFSSCTLKADNVGLTLEG